LNPRTRRQRKLLRRADKAAKRLVSDVAQSVNYSPLLFMYQLGDGRLVSQREHRAAITFRRR
jgi:hypothetical protein